MKLKKPSKKKTRYKRKVSRSKYLTRRYLSLLASLIKVLVILSLIGAGGYLIMYSSLFRVEQVLVDGTVEFVNPQDVILMVESNAKDENIFKLDKEELEKKLADNLLGAKSYEIKKEYPDSLRVTVHERIPIAIIFQGNDDYYLIDDDGFVLGHADPNYKDLPKIRYEKDIKVGLFIDKNLVPIYLELTELFIKEDVRVSSMSFAPKHVNLFLDNDVTVLIGNDKSKQEALRAVKSLVNEAELNDKELRRIDFRYDKVIVLFR